MNSVINNGSMGDTFLFSLNIPYTTYSTGSSQVGASIINKWDSLFKRGIGTALGNIAGYIYITPLNIMITDVVSDINGGCLISFQIDDIVDENDVNEINKNKAFALLFKPNNIENIININDAEITTVGCPGSGCTPSVNTMNQICMPNIGCEDTGQLSIYISEAITGATPILGIKCYFNQAPSASTPLVTI
jgi:hypothetical protein